MNIFKLLGFLLLCAVVVNAHENTADGQKNSRRSRAVHAASTPADAAEMAKTVTIYRDSYGVPHVFGRTDASTVFGFAYAQAEDYLWRVEENFIQALGRASELYGEKSLNEDRLNHALEIPRLAREEYSRLDPEMRALCDGFAAGFNFYLAQHPDQHLRLLNQIEPWYTLAFIRYNYFQNGFARDQNLSGPLQTAENGRDEWDNRGLAANVGSNGWAINSSRSKTGHAMLLINPHLSFFGSGQVYEGHVHSDTGWNFTGYTRFGFPFPYVGHNDDLGWVSTDNAADLEDVYAETFDYPANPFAYRYGSGYKIATEHTEEIGVKTDAGVEVRRFKMIKTHHGPVLSKLGDKLLAIRMAKFEDDGWLREWYEMTRAKDLAQLKAAIRPLNMLFGNVMSADRQGNTFYIYNGAVPRRDPRFDWSKPLDGSDPATEWRGYHTMEELPQLTNPRTGWMQNCNTTPFLLTSEGNPDPAKFPKYMVQEGDNPRGRIARQILAANPSFTFEEWTRAAFDTRVMRADELLPQFLTELKQHLAGGPQTQVQSPMSKVQSQLDIESPSALGTPSNIREAYEVLSAWDHRSTIDSVAMTIFSAWRDRVMGRDREKYETSERRVAALGEVLDSLEQRFGTWRVAWGDVNRLQRRDESRDQQFEDARPSLPVPGVNGGDGAVYTFYAGPSPGQKRYYGVAGATYVSVVEFGPQVRALSIHTFGANGHPDNRHYTDQAPLYARGEFKPAWFTFKQIRANLETAYHPGGEKR